MKTTAAGFLRFSLATVASVCLLVVMPLFADGPLYSYYKPPPYGAIMFFGTLVAPFVLTLLIPTRVLRLWTGAIFVAFALAAVATVFLANECPSSGTSAEPCALASVFPALTALVALLGLALRWGARLTEKPHLK
jgi:hypothetical protein